MNALKSTKSADKYHASNNNNNNHTTKKAEFISKKQSVLTKLNIINLLDKRKAKKTFNLSSDRSSDKLEIFNTQENLKSKTPEIFAENNFTNGSNSNNINNDFNNNNNKYHFNRTNSKDFRSSDFLVGGNNININKRPVYSASSNFNNLNNSVNDNFESKITLKHAAKNSMNFNFNSNFSYGTSSKVRFETEVNNFNSFPIRKNLSTKNVNSCNSNSSNSNINKAAHKKKNNNHTANYNNNSKSIHNVNHNINNKFMHKKGKSNLNGNFNHNFNLFVKPKICVNIINNNNNNNNNNAVNINNINENSKLIISSRRNASTKSNLRFRFLSNFFIKLFTYLIIYL